MRRALALLCLAGCVVEGSTEVALKGDGAVKVDPATGKVTLDTAQVPILPACAAGQLVRRSDDGAGWSCATLAEAGAPTVTWVGIDGKPPTFPPDAHTHPVAQLDDLHWDTLPGKPSEFPPVAHTHDLGEVLGLDTREDLQWTDAGSAVLATKPTGTSPPARDQEQLQSDSIFSQCCSTQLWQSFTAGSTGYLTGVDVRVTNSSGTGTAQLRIFAGEGTAGSDLYSDAQTCTIVAAGGGDGFLRFSIPPKRVVLQEGLKYTFAWTVLSIGGGSLTVRSENSGSQYSGGRASTGATQDFTFGTFMSHDNVVAVTTNGRIGVGTGAPTTMLDVIGDSIRIRAPNTPPTSTSACHQGQFAWDVDYLYVCTSPNRWRRTQLNAGGW